MLRPHRVRKSSARNLVPAGLLMRQAVAAAHCSACFSSIDWSRLCRGGTTVHYSNRMTTARQHESVYRVGGVSMSMKFGLHFSVWKGGAEPLKDTVLTPDTSLQYCTMLDDGFTEWSRSDRFNVMF
jgi:hypothetical protein